LKFSRFPLLTKHIINAEEKVMGSGTWSLTVRSLLIAAAGAVISACATTAPAQARDEVLRSREAQVADIAQAALDKRMAPGVVTMIRDRHGVIYSDIRGLSDVETAAPLHGDHLFRMYSMTKPVTTSVAMMLVEDGTLSLDDPVSKWIPAFADARVYAGGTRPEDIVTIPLERPVLIRDLMQHTAGLGYPFSQDDPVSALFVLRGIETGSRADAPPADGSLPPATLAEMVDRLAGIPLRTQPGDAFTYGNATDVLGRVIEVAAGKRLSDVMSERLFGPLGMTESHFSVPETKVGRLTSAYRAITDPRAQDAILDQTDPDLLPAGDLARVDVAATSPFARPCPIDFGGAGLVSTAGDFLKFAQMVANGGELDGVRILSEETVAQMLTGSLPEKARNTPGLAGRGLDFGLGFAVLADPEVSGLTVPAGTGFWGGAASTIFWVDPENEVSGVILTQVFGGDFRAAYLAMIDAWYANAPPP
jgi:CubicO group peptidase (beta-lactamase class C family)